MKKSLVRALGAMALMLGMAASGALADGGGTGSTSTSTTTPTTPTTTTTATIPPSTAAPATGTLRPTGLITLDSALLKGTIDTHGNAVQWSFEYGTDASYGSYDDNAPHITPAASSPVAVSGPLADLQPNTTYHFRLIMTVPGAGTGAAQSSTSPDGVFTTGNFGQLESAKARLDVGRFSHQVLLPLHCAGKFEPCRGELQVIMHVDGTGIVCASRAYDVAARSGTTARFQLSSDCLSQITARKTGTRGAILVARSSNGQPLLRQAIELALPVPKSSKQKHKLH